MRRQVHFRLLATISFLTVLVVTFSSLNVRLSSVRPLLSKFVVFDAASHQTRQVQRRSLLILGKGRSGTSFLSKMFASGDRIFEVFEPLRYHYLTNVEKLQVLRAFLSCKFTTSNLWKKDYFPPFWYLKETKYYVKPGKNLACVKYRSGKKQCFTASRLLQGFLSKCRQNFDNTVVKELTDRLPHRRLSSVIPEIIDRTDNADIRLLHVVRDPRASINSRIKLGWMPDYKNASFERKVQYHCDEIVENIEFGQQLNKSLKHKYKLITYRDIAVEPVDTAREVFKFAGYSMSDKTLKWILNRTNPDHSIEATAQFKMPYSLVRDSKANIDKWRSESPPGRTRIIEKICQPLLELLEKIRFEREYWLV